MAVVGVCCFLEIRTVDRKGPARLRRRRVLQTQRERRSRLRRIDYQDVSDEAAVIIDGECGPFSGGDYSSVLNRIVVEWGAVCGDFRN